MSGDYSVIISDAISQVSEVRFYDETLEHVAEQHPELRIILASIRAASENVAANPTRVHASTTRPDRGFVFVSENTTYKGNWLHVPVLVVDERSARWVTSYFSDDASPGPLVWSAGS